MNRQALGAGDTLGSAYVTFLNSMDLWRDNTALGTLHRGVLGDGTLRAQVLDPPENLVLVGASPLTLTWAPSTVPGMCYLVYRSTGGILGGFVNLTASAPVTGHSFTDGTPPPGPKLYQVRAARVLTTGSGTFTNLSQAAFLQVN